MQSVLTEHLIRDLLLFLDLFFVVIEIISELVDVVVDIRFNDLSELAPLLFVKCSRMKVSLAEYPVSD